MYYRHFNSKAGFTLIELGIVLIVLSLMASAMLSIVNQNIRLERETRLKERLDKITSSLIAYRNAYGYLPCPADITLPDENTNFGVQGANAGACTGGTPTAGWDDHDYDTACYAVGGAVPVVTLGLPEDYAYDPWNGRFLYFVDYRATSSDGFAKLSAGNTTATIRVYAFGDSDNITTSAIVALASMGPNGNGAFINSGSQKDAGDNTQEIVNNRGVEAPGDTPDQCAVFYAHRTTIGGGDVTDVFDDTVRYYTVGFFAGNSDKTIENR